MHRVVAVTSLALVTALVASACRRTAPPRVASDAPPSAPPTAPPTDAPSGAAPSSDAATACAATPAAACAAQPGCAPIMGQPHQASPACAGPAAAVGCMSADTACADAITFARDPDGRGWWFMDTCVPPGWTAAPYPAGSDAPPPGC